MYDVTITSHGDNMDVTTTCHFKTYREAFKVFSDWVKSLDSESEFNTREVSFYEMDPGISMLMCVTDIDYNA